MSAKTIYLAGGCFWGVQKTATALSEEGLSGDEVYKRADEMLYEMKEKNRGSFALYTN